MNIAKNFQTLARAAAALLLSTLLAATAQAQNEPLKRDGPLGKTHATEKVKCVKCHGEGRRTDPVSSDTCLGCHGDGSSRALAALTAKVKPLNPHENRHYGTDADCALCHRVHEPSVNYCADCHPRFDFKVK